MDKKIERKPWYKRKALTLTGVVCLLLIICYSFIYSSKGSTLNVDNERLSVSKAWRGDFQEYVPVDGVVAPGETTYLDIIQGGMVEKVYVEDGTEVHKGDTLAKLSNSNLELEYMNRETQMFDILNNLQNSKATLDRNRVELMKQLMEIDYKLDVLQKKYDTDKELIKDGVISRYEFAETEREYNYLVNKMKVAKAAYASDSAFICGQMHTLASGTQRMRNNLGTMHQILDQLYIVAPLSGQLSSLNANVGELKKAGDKLGQIDVLDFYKIKVNMDERYVAKVYAGQDVLMDYGGKNYNLKVSRILPEVKDGTFAMYLLFRDTVPEGIRRGQTLPVRVKFGGVSKALMIARGAFYQATGGNWIYVMDKNKQTAVKRKIRIGRQNADTYEVLEGLEEGEEVIVSSYKAFNDNEQLILNNKK